MRVDVRAGLDRLRRPPDAASVLDDILLGVEITHGNLMAERNIIYCVHSRYLVTLERNRLHRGAACNVLHHDGDIVIGCMHECTVFHLFQPPNIDAFTMVSYNKKLILGSSYREGIRLSSVRRENRSAHLPD